MANDVESNLTALREARTTAQTTALEHLKRYVAHRTATFEAFNRLDPNSQATGDARERLEKARRDLEAFARSIGVALDNREAPANEGEIEQAGHDPNQSTTDDGSD